MTYYDELGLTQAARDDEIRKAHRTLSKLLHPDQQMDPAVRQAAEIQMRRLNGIVEILLDPDQRRRYDENLKEPAVGPVIPGWRNRLLSRIRLNTSLGWIAIIATAVLLTVGVVWFYAGDLMHFGPTASEVTPQPRKVAPASETYRKRQNPPAARRTALNPSPQAAPVSEFVPERRLEAVVAKPELELPPVLHSESPSTSSPAPSAPAAPAAAAAIVRSPGMPSEPPVAGLWVFASGSQTAEQSRTTLYAPEFIELNLHAIENTLYGEYESRYKVADRAISPHVRFVFHGTRAPLSSFEWLSEDGSKGTVDLKLVTAQRLQVNWRVTEFGSRMGLGAGTAVLTRKSDP